MSRKKAVTTYHPLAVAKSLEVQNDAIGKLLEGRKLPLHQRRNARSRHIASGGRGMPRCHVARRREITPDVDATPD